LAEPSGVLQVDVDHLSEDEWNAVAERLKRSPHVLAVWRSVSGDGLKATVLIPADARRHRDAFYAVKAHVKELTGKNIDEACKDVARLCFFSYDPEIWVNRNGARPIRVPEKPERPEPARATDTEPAKAKAREIIESVVGWLGEWQTDERGRAYAHCRCPDTSREHHNEPRPNTRVYLNPGSVPRIECRHGECAAAVKKRNDVLKREWLAQKDILVLPPIEDLDAYIDKEIVLPPDVIERMLHHGGKMVVGGGAKSFKTWQQLDVLVSVATGVPWLGFPTKQGRVLYLNFELPAAFCWKRIQDICRRKGVRPSRDQFHVWNLRGYAADIEQLVPMILARIQETEGRQTEYVLIVLDPIYKVLGGCATKTRRVTLRRCLMLLSVWPSNRKRLCYSERTIPRAIRLQRNLSTGSAAAASLAVIRTRF
jgi:hypothetical protein